jgi:hypothetical protein
MDRNGSLNSVFMVCFHKVHDIRQLVSFSLHALVSETTGPVSMKFGIGCLKQTLSDKFSLVQFSIIYL